ncbi:MAG: hypothetical protein JWR34_6544 [Mycobacterium sp.]|nr:hypothetical protein [Mycobacterium sp.]
MNTAIMARTCIHQTALSSWSTSTNPLCWRPNGIGEDAKLFDVNVFGVAACTLAAALHG